MTDKPATRRGGGASSKKIAQTPREIDTDELFRGAKAVIINHEGEPYRLSVTKNGKLILQK